MNQTGRVLPGVFCHVAPGRYFGHCQIPATCIYLFVVLERLSCSFFFIVWGASSHWHLLLIKHSTKIAHLATCWGGIDRGAFQLVFQLVPRLTCPSRLWSLVSETISPLLFNSFLFFFFFFFFF
jgi:hypothetical protein